MEESCCFEFSILLCFCSGTCTSGIKSLVELIDQLFHLKYSNILWDWILKKTQCSPLDWGYNLVVKQILRYMFKDIGYNLQHRNKWSLCNLCVHECRLSLCMLCVNACWHYAHMPRSRCRVPLCRHVWVQVLIPSLCSFSDYLGVSLSGQQSLCDNMCFLGWSFCCLPHNLSLVWFMVQAVSILTFSL